MTAGQKEPINKQNLRITLLGHPSTRPGSQRCSSVRVLKAHPGPKDRRGLIDSDFDALTHEKKMIKPDKEERQIPSHLVNVPTVQSETSLLLRRDEALSQQIDAAGDDRNGKAGMGGVRGGAVPPAKGKARVWGGKGRR